MKNMKINIPKINFNWFKKEKEASAYLRFGAFLLDVALIWIVMLIITILVPDNAKIAELSNQYNYLNKAYSEGMVQFSGYFNQITAIIRDLDIARLRFNLINFILIFGYFGFLPYYNNGSTIGQMLFHIKIKKNKGKLEIKNLIIRAFVVGGLLYSMVTFITMFLLPGKIYFVIATIALIIQILMVIVSAFMIIYKKNKHGFVDIISSTKVVTVKDR